MGLQKLIPLLLFVLFALLFFSGCAQLEALGLIPGAPGPIPMPTPITESYPYPPATPPVVAPPAKDATPVLLTGLVATPTGAVLTWSFTQAASTPDINGFVISLGTAPQTYTRTVTVADPTARQATITGLNLTTFNYAIIQSTTDFGMYSVASPELVFGGTPSTPVFLKAAPVLP